MLYDPHTPIPFQYSTLPQPQSHPGTSSSFDPCCDRSYIDRLHQHPIRESWGTQLASFVLDDFLSRAIGDSPLYDYGYLVFQSICLLMHLGWDNILVSLMVVRVMRMMNDSSDRERW